MSCAASLNAGPLLVLIADRHALLAQAVAHALRHRSELEIVDAHPQSGVEATKTALDIQSHIALIDLWLDGVTGIAATHSITGAACQTRVIVLGWRHTRDHIQQALAAGAAGFVTKQVPVDDLAAAVCSVAGGEQVVIDPDVGALTRAGPPMQLVPRSGPRLAFAEAFTVRELEVLSLLGAAFLVDEIAQQLMITSKTAQTHITSILEKTGTRSQLQAVAAARAHGYLP